MALLACSYTGPARHIFAPAASIQQLTISNEGNWQIHLRLRNYSTVAMQFDQLKLVLALDQQTTLTLEAAPNLFVSADSADSFIIDLQPSSAVRLLIADTLAAGRALPYTLQGQIKAKAVGGGSGHFKVEHRSHLTLVPGLPGVLR